MKTFVRSTFLAAFLAAIAWVLLPASETETVFVAEPAMGQSDLRIIQNNGQWDERIDYSIPLNGGEVFLEQGRLTYALFHVPDHHGHHSHHDSEGQLEDSLVKGHAFHVSFPNANPEALLEPSLKYPEYHNYFLGNDESRWAGEVPLFGQVTYQEIWPGVDYRVYGFGDALKYDFILAPGTDPATVSLQYEGLSSLSLSNDTLYLETTVRQLTEFPPIAYQVLHGEKVLVPCDYRLDGNTLSYVFPEGYDSSQELIIDPTIVFSTYSGSYTDNWGYTATYDSLGNSYVAGVQYGASSVFGGYPVVGPFQSTYQGGDFDVTISKVNQAGTQLFFSTFLGGTDEEEPLSLVVDHSSRLIVLGRTSSADFPILNAYQSIHNGEEDFFVIKFSDVGSSIVGSTFLGGSDDDGINVSSELFIYGETKYNHMDDARCEVIVDIGNNIYIAGATKSTDFPVTHGATILNGPQDGVVAKLSPGLDNLLWSRFFGGEGTDACYSLRLESGTNKLFVSGGTSSSLLPVTGFAYQGTFAGGITDGFISKLVPGTNTIEACTYLGTGSYDQIYLIDLDADGDVYVTGQTNGSWQIINPPGLSSIYSNPGANQFITKLSNNLSSVKYSTSFGSSNSQYPSIYPTAFYVGSCERIYLAGCGGGFNTSAGSPNLGNAIGMPLTPDAIRDSTFGSDFYLMVLDEDAQGLLYGSYFGSVDANKIDHVDGGTSRFDESGVLHHVACADCGGTNTFPTQPSNVYSNTNNSPNCSMALFKIELNSTANVASFILRDLQGNPVSTADTCGPLSVFFENTSLFCGNSNLHYQWDFDDNGTTSTVYSPQHVFQNPGSYEIMLIVTDSSSFSDTAFQTIIIPTPAQADAGLDQTICIGDTFMLQSTTSGVSFLWSPSTSLISSDTISNPFGVIKETTVQIILKTTDNNGCQSLDTVVITGSPFPISDFNYASSNQSFTYVFNNFSLEASQYFWDFGDQSSSTVLTPIHTYQFGGTYEVTLIAANNCGADTMKTTILNVGLEDQGFAHSIMLYPNPTKGKFTVIANLEPEEYALIEVFNSSGKLIYAENRNPDHRELRFNLDLSSEPQGIYFVKVTNGDRFGYKKVMRY